MYLYGYMYKHTAYYIIVLTSIFNNCTYKIMAWLKFLKFRIITFTPPPLFKGTVTPPKKIKFIVL